MTTVKRHLQIKGYGTALPAHTVTFKDQTRYRVKEGEETQIDLAARAIESALNHAGLEWQTSTAWFRLVRLVFSPSLVQQLLSMSAWPRD